MTSINTVLQTPDTAVMFACKRLPQNNPKPDIKIDFLYKFCIISLYSKL